MDKENVVVYSGGHRGTESAFGEAAEQWGVREVTYSFPGHRVERAVNVGNLSDDELARGGISMELASKLMNRTYYEKKKIRKVLQLIFHMVNSGYQVFAVGHILADKTVKGGTGWAVELAKLFNRPVHVYDQDKQGWFTWQGGDWQEDHPQISHDTLCVSGTRHLRPEGREAINALFNDAFGTP